jgi:PiT family inorganic phosphate transporter
VNLGGLGKVVVCWIGTPVGAALMAVVIYRLFGEIYNRLDLNLFQSDAAIRSLMIATGIYGAYALGANNVANVTAVFVGAELISVPAAALIGGLSIAGGILTFSRPVMETVGKRLLRLDPFSALIVTFALAGTVHFYSWVGVPVSTSQAVVGGVLGIGLVKGTKTVSRRTLYQILTAWIVTPLIAAVFTLSIHFLIHLRYMP